uniref:Band 7 domain-containing protein n=1 Tax=Esox lucius TaxID=8010 RepID=A0AAY5KND6_ESOLU
NQLFPHSRTTETLSDADIGLCGWIIVGFSLLLMVVTLPISIWMCIKIVKEYERAIIFRLGRILRGGAKGPGLFFILPCTDSFINVDMRTITFDIPPQEVLTKDSVTVSVDGVVYYRVQNATLAVANITNADAATRLLAQTTLRNVLGTKNLAQILSDREEIAHNMQVLKHAPDTIQSPHSNPFDSNKNVHTDFALCINSKNVNGPDSWEHSPILHTPLCSCKYITIGKDKKLRYCF